MSTFTSRPSRLSRPDAITILAYNIPPGSTGERYVAIETTLRRVGA